MKVLFYLVFLLAMAALVIVFTALNPQAVTIDLSVQRFTLPLSVVIILSVFFGVLLGLLFQLPGALGRRRHIGRLRRQLAQAEEELSRLRKLPVQED